MIFAKPFATRGRRATTARAEGAVRMIAFVAIALLATEREVAAASSGSFLPDDASHRLLSGGDYGWSNTTIYTAADEAESVFGIDVDGDGDVDVIYAACKDDTIAWSENLDGNGGNWTHHEIYAATNICPEWVFGIDVDGDGDIDVIYALISYPRDTIAWSENRDGDGGSWTYHEITTAVNLPVSVFGIDMDGDGDIDVISASHEDDKIVWSENLDGSGESWTSRTISTAMDGPSSVFGIDLDGDGDIDVLSGSLTCCAGIGWHENRDGSGRSWSYHRITTQDAMSVFGIDLDGDGDIDVLSASRWDDTIAWSENLDGSGGSWTFHEITTAADGADSVFGIDVDGDGHIDVMSASLYDDTIAWSENLDGSGGSWTYHVITTAADGADAVCGIDVDGDGDIDAISASEYDDTIAWYGNLAPVPVPTLVPMPAPTWEPTMITPAPTNTLAQVSAAQPTAPYLLLQAVSVALMLPFL